MARSPGRPAVGPRVTVRLDPALLERVDAQAARSGESRAATIRRVLETAVTDPGVDVAQIRRALERTPAERIRAMAGAEHALSSLRGRAVT